jgi:hypothetical protein
MQPRLDYWKASSPGGLAALRHDNWRKKYAGLMPSGDEAAPSARGRVLIGAELGPVNYRPQFIVAVDIIRAG